MNIHPPLSAFPFVICTLLALVEVAITRRDSENLKFARSFLLGGLAVATTITYFSGYLGEAAARRGFSVATGDIAYHQSWGRAVLICLLPTLVLAWLSENARHHQKIFKVLWRGFFIVLYGFVIVTSYEGGRLVFEHGAGVQAPK